ncbi:MAG: phosphohydrolase [Zetaproteobacteria bacterium]|nr:MAG: phosphohydrolase [Zetaproteobacteria bacterium]
MFGNCKNKDWPDSFDFNTDEICQTVFKPFIENEMAQLKAYDQERPDDITYIFHEHAQRVADNMKKTCLHIGLDEVIANNMYWAILPHDIGKKNLPLDIWDTEEKPQDSLKKYRRTHTLLGAQIVQEYFPDIDHPFKDLLIDVMANHHEQIDGNGTHGVTGDMLSLPVRLSAIVEAYDGWRIWRPHFEDRDISPPAVLERMRAEKGAEIFDMDLFESFAEMKMMEYKSSLSI